MRWFLFISFSLPFALIHAQTQVIADLESDTPYPNAQSRITEQECSTVDLTKESGPVRLQVGGTCYAYTAMELLNFNEEKKYSAIHLASLHQDRSEKPNEVGVSKLIGFSGGSVANTLINAYQNGVCPDELIISIDAEKVNTKSYEKIMNLFESSKKIDLTKQCIQDVFSMPNPLEMILQIARNVEVEKAKKDKHRILVLVQKSFPSFPLTEFENVFNESRDVATFFNALIINSCKNNLIKINTKKVKFTYLSTSIDKKTNKKIIYDESREKMFKEMNEKLQNHNPVGISYYSYGLIYTRKSEEHSAHASLVAGRMWQEATKDFSGRVKERAGCYYLVKNSWGKDWSPPYGSKARSVAGMPGYYMLSEKNFKEHVYGITTLE